MWKGWKLERIEIWIVTQIKKEKNCYFWHGEIEIFDKVTALDQRHSHPSCKIVRFDKLVESRMYVSNVHTWKVQNVE